MYTADLTRFWVLQIYSPSMEQSTYHGRPDQIHSQSIRTINILGPICIYYKSIQKFKICHWIQRPWKLESNIENKRALHIWQTSCDWFNCCLSLSHIHNKITQLWSLQIHQKILNKRIDFYWSQSGPETLCNSSNELRMHLRSTKSDRVCRVCFKGDLWLQHLDIHIFLTFPSFTDFWPHPTPGEEAGMTYSGGE